MDHSRPYDPKWMKTYHNDPLTTLRSARWITGPMSVGQSMPENASACITYRKKLLTQSLWLGGRFL